MIKPNTRLKKWIAVLAATVAISALSTPARAQSTDAASLGYLAQIAQYTNGTLQAVNNLPTYMNALVSFAMAWLSKDTSKSTATLQADFANVTNAIVQGSASQLSLQQQLTRDFFGSTVTPQTLPSANDLTYQTLLGAPFFNPDPRKTDNSPAPDSAYNYTKNVSGINITHVIPALNWRGSQFNQQKYAAYFVTISAIQTFNAYILSQLYTDYSNGNTLSKAQLQLVQDASNSDWFAQIASENIGIVLRQILMFNSQVFVLLTQMLDTQKKLLETQAMSNSLLILLNQQNEDLLIKKATGVLPG